MTEWPWNYDKGEKLTEPVLKEIVENLPLFASDVTSIVVRTPNERGTLRGDFQVYCMVVKEEYFAARFKHLRGSIRSEARGLMGEAFDLIERLTQYVMSPEVNEWPPDVYSRWHRVVQEFNLCMSSQGQEEPVETPPGVQSVVAPDAEAQEQADSQPVIEIRLSDFSKSVSLNLLTDLLQDTTRRGIRINAKRHGMRQPKSLKELLKSHKHKLKIVADRIKRKDDGRIVLDITPEKIKFSRE
jgi:hypothetical protein